MFPFVTWMLAVDGESITTIAQAAGSMTLGDAFNNTDASMALWYAVIITVIFTYIYYLCSRLMNIREASDALMNGIKSMVPALVILVMAWSIGTIIKSSPEDGGLGLASYLSEVVVGGGFPLSLVPAIVFVLSALIAFATGTSWGTFAIMIPIVMPIAVGLASSKGLDASACLNATLISISAVLGGATLGVGLLVGGVIFSMVGSSISGKADKAYSQMLENEKVINKICKYLEELNVAAKNYYNDLNSANNVYNDQFRVMRYIVDSNKEADGTVDWRKLRDADKTTINNVVMLVGLLYHMCKVKLVKKTVGGEQINTINTTDINEARQKCTETLKAVKAA